MTTAPDANSAQTAEIREGSHDPIAYTFEAATHCPQDAAARFGVDSEGFIPQDATDGEGNPVGAIFSWDTSAWPEGIYCDDCGAELSEPEQDRPDADDDYISDTRAGYCVSREGSHLLRATDTSYV